MKSKPKNGRGPVAKRAARLPKGPAVKAVRAPEAGIAAHIAADVGPEIVRVAELIDAARKATTAAVRAVSILGESVMAFLDATGASVEEMTAIAAATADALDAIERMGPPRPIPTGDALAIQLCDDAARSGIDAPGGRDYAVALQGAVRRALYGSIDDDAARDRMWQARRRGKAKRAAAPPRSIGLRALIAEVSAHDPEETGPRKPQAT